MNSDNIFVQAFENKILMTTISAWLIAQTIKVITGVVRHKRFDFRWFVGTGGMPSSHAAGATCMATAIGIQCGFDSVYFALGCFVALIVMFDAHVVRHSTGRQAYILNKIMDDIYWKGRIHEGRLRELVGHTPIEVIIGGILGAVIAIVSMNN